MQTAECPTRWQLPEENNEGLDLASDHPPVALPARARPVPTGAWAIAAAIVLLVTAMAGATIVVHIKRDARPDTTIEVAEGSKVKISADGAVEVTLPDGQATAPKPLSPTLVIYQPAREKLKSPFLTPPKLAFSPDGKLLASTDAEETVFLWDAKTGEEVRRLRGPAKRPNQGAASVAFSPDGKLLAIGGRRRIFLWEPATGRKVRMFEEFHSSFRSLAFSQDGKTLASLDGDYHMIQLWNVETSELFDEVEAGQQGSAVHYSADGRILLACDEKDRGRFPKKDILRLPERWRVGVHGSPISIAAGMHVSFVNEEETVLALWETASSQMIGRFAVQSKHGRVSSIAISPGGDRLAVAYRDGVVDIWHLKLRPAVEDDAALPDGVADEVNTLFADLRSGDPRRHNIAMNRLIEIGKPAAAPLKRELAPFKHEPTTVGIVTHIVNVVQGLADPVQAQGLAVQAGPAKPVFDSVEGPWFVLVFKNQSKDTLLGQIDFNVQGLMVEDVADGTKWRLLYDFDQPLALPAGGSDKVIDIALPPGKTRIEQGPIDGHFALGYRWVQVGAEEPKGRGRAVLPPGRYRAKWAHQVGARKDFLPPRLEQPMRFLTGAIEGAPFEFSVRKAPAADGEGDAAATSFLDETKTDLSAADELKLARSVWHVVRHREGGLGFGAQDGSGGPLGPRVVIAGETITLQLDPMNPEGGEFTYRVRAVDATASPKQVTVEYEKDGRTLMRHGIYSRDKDVIKCEFSQPGAPRPKAFDAFKSPTNLLILRRIKEDGR